MLWSLSTLVSGCFSDDVTADDLCAIELSNCDSDDDGVLNGGDDFPADAACSVRSTSDCLACGTVPTQGRFSVS